MPFYLMVMMIPLKYNNLVNFTVTKIRLKVCEYVALLLMVVLVGGEQVMMMRDKSVVIFLSDNLEVLW
jgi:hypothetical protein